MRDDECKPFFQDEFWGFRKRDFSGVTIGGWFSIHLGPGGRCQPRIPPSPARLRGLETSDTTPLCSINSM